MQKFLFTTLLSILFLSSTIWSQEAIVQAFNYDSETRDSVITFPTDDHNKWEKILMIYSMRCKDGLISPPIQGQTNIGCGEWDYSCNTYITDSAQVDSLFRISPDHVISNFSDDVFEYRTSPTFSYHQSILKEVDYGLTLSEEEFMVNNGAVANDVFSGADGLGKRFQYLIKKSELDNGALTAGAISGLKLQVDQGQGSFDKVKVRMKHYSSSNNLICLEQTNWQEVYYQNINIDGSNNWLKFYEDFDWNGTDDILVDFSFTINSSDLMINAKDLQEDRVVMATNENSVLSLNGSGRFNVQGDYSSISDQITISFWSKGAGQLPVNTTFLEGVDEQNRRQVNIHLPWGNGQVYWDCGNNGGGYDRINLPAAAQEYKNNWTHWTFTKNASSGSMKIYKNGTLWHSGTGKTQLMNIKELRIGSSVNNNVRYYGLLDDVRIWNVELNAADISAAMCDIYDVGDTHYDNLVLAYDFNQDTANEIIDASANQFNANIEGALGHETQFARTLSGTISKSTFGPALTCVRGNYQISLNEITVLEEVENIPNQVDRYIVQGTDLILEETNFYYATGDMPVYDEDGTIVDYVNVAPEASIAINDLEHYTKSPMQMEIMSFVTPYGINLDMGIQGESWTFDVTDLGPILKGNKRIYLTRGGQWQEDMDIKFLFYEGTPPRNVKSVEQIWPVISTNFTAIQEDRTYEPRTIVKNAADEAVVIKTTITGHGQEGEFIPRTHGIRLDGIPFDWQVWKECADNPIYPQGGTWVYDRAGWCPGAPSDTEVTDLTYFMYEDVDYEIDYTMIGGSGDSRYIVSSQLVRYGPHNFENDVTMADIVYPSEKIEHGRYNPNCGRPKVIIKNTGSEELNSATITYGIVGGETKTFEWTGFLDFLETATVTLDFLATMAGSDDELTFFARVENPNGQTDEYANNNEMVSNYSVVDMYASDIIINLKTNNNNTETGFKVYDENGDQIFSRGPNGLGSNTTYLDTLTNLNGCYKIVVTDSGENGLEWWANPNGGSGYIRVKSIGGNYRTIGTDFGSIVDYNFVAGEVMVNTEEPIANTSIDIFPNPGRDVFHIQTEGFSGGNEHAINR